MRPHATEKPVKPGLECRHLTVTRPGEKGRERTVLDDLQARFPAGILSLVTGPNGAGKSTLLHVLAGLIRPRAGEVSADGQAVSRWTAAHRDRWRRQVGIVFQTPRLLGDLTVTENLIAPLIPRGQGLNRLRAAAIEALADTGIAHLATRLPRRLSSGERQRVSLARALVGRPRYLLADEPTAHQDEDGLATTLAALDRERRRGAVVVVVSHDRRLPAGLEAGFRFRLNRGRLRKEP